MANVIITGCSRGIGYELALLFAQSGHKVLALSRNDKPIKELNEVNILHFLLIFVKKKILKSSNIF